MTTKQELESWLGLLENDQDIHLELIDNLAGRIQKLEELIHAQDIVDGNALEERVRILEWPGQSSLEARVLEALGRWLVLKQAQGGDLLHPVTVAQEITTLRREFTEAGS